MITLKGCGPYLTLVSDTSFDEISKVLALKYRVVHKIVANPLKPRQLCVFGQKCFNLVTVDETTNQFRLELANDVMGIELEDWIFDAFWLSDGAKTYLVFACAHNQCVLYDLSEAKAWKISDCDQKCMLYAIFIVFHLLYLSSSISPSIFGLFVFPLNI